MTDFSDALKALKEGKRISRSGWNGKGMWLCLVQDWTGAFGRDLPVTWQGTLPFIAMFTADQHMVPWLASQTDILADDWTISP